MSGFGFSSSDEANYSYATAYQIPVAQYTQSQVNQYFLQYGYYPPQPYNVIPDFYPQPIAATSNACQPIVPSSPYDTPQWRRQMEHLEPPTSQPPSRSNSRGRTWTCDIPDCTSSANFTRLADLQRHQATVHGIGRPEFPCTVGNCSRVGAKGFTRRDHLVEHLRNFHHIDIPKRRPGERSAFPFGYPEGFHDQDASTVSGRGQQPRLNRSDQRGGIVKPTRSASRAAGIERAIDQTLDAPHRVRMALETEE